MVKRSQYRVSLKASSTPFVYYSLLSVFIRSFIVLCLSVGLLWTGACAATVETVKVERVIDGDTIVIVGGERVRYIGIDAPESGEPLYYEAKRFNEQLVDGKYVKLERDVSDKDDYGRLLRYVYVDSIFVNGEMVRNGYAVAKRYPPNTKHQIYLEKMEKEARQLRRGLWQ